MNGTLKVTWNKVVYSLFPSTILALARINRLQVTWSCS